MTVSCGEVRSAPEALAWARQLNHATSIDLSLFYKASLHQLRGEKQALLATLEEQLAHAKRYGLQFNAAYAMVVRGWATGNVEEALQGVEMQKNWGCLGALTYYLGILADVELEKGQADRALEHLEQAEMRVAPE